MKIHIEVTDEDYFLKLLYILRSIPPFNELRSLDLRVLAAFYTENYKLRAIPVEQRNIILFSPQLKKQMMKSLKVSEANYYNSISRLRKIGIFSDNIISPKYTIFKHKEITFIFDDDE